MQKPEHTERLSQENFRLQAETMLTRTKMELERLHGAPPCMFAADIETVAAWTEAKQDAELSTLRKTFAAAEAIVQQAERERETLWKTSDANASERALPPIVFFKQIREDLEAYEEILAFVRSRRPSALPPNQS
jgi:hypothetical protein